MSSKAGIAHRSEMKKSGKKKTRCFCSGRRMRIWRRSWKQRRREGSTLQLDLMQKAPELVVHERMAQGEKVAGAKVKKKVKGWSSEEMKDQANSSLGEDTEEMRMWRGLKEEEIDQCWKKLAEEIEEEVLDKYKVEDSKREAGAIRWSGGVYREAGSTEHETGEKIAGQESSPCLESTTCSVGKACMKIPRKKKK